VRSAELRNPKLQITNKFENGNPNVQNVPGARAARGLLTVDFIANRDFGNKLSAGVKPARIFWCV
jgi:hypothetical protein